jgi:uncharacterized protein YifE (UPF0438 family)
MNTLSSFSSSRKFYGDDYFPYGISRCGEFTNQQVDLLTSHGWAYLELAEGLRSPETPEEEAFILSCRGEREAVTEHEKVWALFCEKVSRPKVNVRSPLLTTEASPE